MVQCILCYIMYPFLLLELTVNPERSEYFLAGLKEGGASVPASNNTKIFVLCSLSTATKDTMLK